MDILEMLRNEVGCHYISDLRVDPYRAKAMELLTAMESEACSDEEREVALKYLYAEL